MLTIRTFAWIAASLLAVGCRSPFYADRGAAGGALAGAGVGALVGDAVGDAGAGAVIGAGMGALTGAAVGTALDDIQAQNRAEIAATLGRQVQPGSATPDEVIAMTRAGVDPLLIQNYVRTSGVSQPLGAAEVIYLHDNGVATGVIQAMQNPTPPMAPVAAGPPPVIVEEHYYAGPRGPYCAPHFGYYHGYRRRPRVSWGVSVAK